MPSGNNCIIGFQSGVVCLNWNTLCPDDSPGLLHPDMVKKKILVQHWQAAASITDSHAQPSAVFASV